MTAPQEKTLVEKLADQLLYRVPKVLSTHSAGRCEVQLLDSYFPNFEPSHPLQYLARSLALLAEADLAYFAEGWQDARGCCIEKACADEYGIDHIVCEGSDGE